MIFSPVGDEVGSSITISASVVWAQPCGLYKHTIILLLWFTQGVPQPYLSILGRLGSRAGLYRIGCHDCAVSNAKWDTYLQSVSLQPL